MIVHSSLNFNLYIFSYNCILTEPRAEKIATTKLTKAHYLHLILCRTVYLPSEALHCGKAQVNISTTECRPVLWDLSAIHQCTGNPVNTQTRRTMDLVIWSRLWMCQNPAWGPWDRTKGQPRRCVRQFRFCLVLYAYQVAADEDRWARNDDVRIEIDRST